MEFLAPLFICGIFVIQIAMLAFVIWMVIDCAMNEPNQGTEKIVWILVIIFVPLAGPFIYYFVRRPERIATHGK
ncbi:MAG: PLDc_N domain-containing protein [Planctomycetaceae bacterium]|nr:PLDc_N domain-containing protein [Planctomycetaceae bacterium]